MNRGTEKKISADFISVTEIQKIAEQYLLNT